MVTVTCTWCGEQFSKPLAYVKQNEKKGQKNNFCCMEHSVNWLAAEGRRVRQERSRRGVLRNGKGTGKQKDVLSPFKAHLIHARRRAKEQQRECTLTLEDLKEQWELQQGLCSYTGLPMVNPETTSAYAKTERLWNKASLDRIDSSKGYVPGNIEFVSMMANLCKNGWTKEDVILFCKSVANNWQE
jgi:hypothetical protein